MKPLPLLCHYGLRVHSSSCRHMSASVPFPVLTDALDTSTPQAQAALAVSGKALEELRHQQEVCRQGGGEKGIARHVKLNKKVLVRERIRSLLDPDTELWELCMTAGLGLDYGDVPTGGVVAGVGKIHGTDVMLVANDATVSGGTFYPITVTKQLRLQEIARQNRLPCLAVVDTGGAFLPLQSELFIQGGRSFGMQAIMSGEGIPQVALVSGMCTAGGAYAPTMSDVAIITHRIGNIYLGGPALVKAATGEVVKGEDLGGATIHCSVSGITDHFAKDEEESYTIARDVIATLNLSPTPSLEMAGSPPLYSAQGLEVLAGKEKLTKTDIMSLLARITDGSRFSEFKAMFGGNLVCGFGFLYGQLTGFLSNCGPITAGDAQKGGHFVQLCDTRDLPMVFIQNSSQSLGSSCDADTMKERAKFIQCQSVVRVPKVTLNVGGAVSDENYTMCGPSFQPNFYMMWPTATLSKSDPSFLSSPETDEVKKPRKPLSQFPFPPTSAAWVAGRALCDGLVAPAQSREMVGRAVQVSMRQHLACRDTRGVERGVARM